ncbi:MAG: helix-turn-helix domain-containing protein [Candidatus Pacebacteria bacterium]|nr:helix-turn-helix domain-containing protein [Candidatus Paceibacterota bacterium]
MQRIERNMKLNTIDPVTLHGFTQIPNFILRDPGVSIGAKTVYALLLSYAWHNDLCFPGQERLAKDVGMGIASVNRFIKELEECSLIEIMRRGQGKTNFYTVNFVVKKRVRKS